MVVALRGLVYLENRLHLGFAEVRHGLGIEVRAQWKPRAALFDTLEEHHEREEEHNFFVLVEILLEPHQLPRHVHVRAVDLGGAGPHCRRADSMPPHGTRRTPDCAARGCGARHLCSISCSPWARLYATPARRDNKRRPPTSCCKPPPISMLEAMSGHLVLPLYA